MTILQYQKKCSKEYLDSIKFPKETSYLHGNPVRAVVPIETAVGKIMVIGPQPAPKVYFENDIPDVPLGDATAPFSIEPYFDGSRVRSSFTGQELSEVILETLEIKREHCWLTSLVKVHLFDDDHVKKYHRLGKEITENSSKYMEFANKFEAGYISQGYYENRSVFQTLDLGWELLSMFDNVDLKRIDVKLIEKYMTKYRKGDAKEAAE